MNISYFQKFYGFYESFMIHKTFIKLSKQYEILKVFHDFLWFP